MYSTIKKKKCKCGCGKYPKPGYDGYAYSCAPEAIKERQSAKTRQQIKGARQRLQNKVMALKPRRDEQKIKSQLWFSARNYEMTGICHCGCGKPSSKDDPKYSKFSACHILPQRHFESVRYHPLNFIEMAFWGGCHTNFDDNGSDNWDKLECWPEIVSKFKVLYPLTLPEERKHIPQILRDALNPSGITDQNKQEND